MSSIEHRLRRIEDELAIAQLRARYCHLVDDGNWPELVALFTEDGRFQGLEAAEGHAALLHFFSETLPTLQDAAWHFCSNGTIAIDGDRATGRLSLDLRCVQQGVSYTAAGYYDDVLLRVDGQWRFKSRVVTFYYFAPLSAGFGPPKP